MNKSIYAKISFILIILFLGLSLSACAKEEEPVEEPTIISVDNEVVELTIPESYPSDLIPIYPNAYLSSVVEANQSFTLMFYSKDEATVVIEYYKNIFRDAKNVMETNQDESYTIFGELDGYTFTFDCAPEDDLESYQTLVLLSVVLNQK